MAIQRNKESVCFHSLMKENHYHFIDMIMKYDLKISNINWIKLTNELTPLTETESSNRYWKNSEYYLIIIITISYVLQQDVMWML